MEDNVAGPGITKEGAVRLIQVLSIVAIDTTEAGQGLTNAMQKVVEDPGWKALCLTLQELQEASLSLEASCVMLPEPERKGRSKKNVLISKSGLKSKGLKSIKPRRILHHLDRR